MIRRENIIDALCALGERLDGFGENTAGRALMEKACAANPWFMPEEVVSALRAIRSRMLQREELSRWAARYPWAAEPCTVLLIMAGNIPLAGFFDLLCILAAGHRCIAKYSSKDTVLMEAVTGWLGEICPEIPICPPGQYAPQAVIASGSDNAVRHLKSQYGELPALLRGNRASAAVLSGGESDGELELLARDIFIYSGLGCRNISHLLLPKGYDIGTLAGKLGAFPSGRINPKYLNNYRQRKAVLTLSDSPVTDGGFFLLTLSPHFPAAISEITYHYYNRPEEAAAWVSEHEPEIQCIAARPEWSSLLPFPAVGFGQTQSPTLYDFPDRRDTMMFVAGL